MTLHAIVQYLKYRWQAMGRHGTHSPFVYELVEQVLLNKGAIKRDFIVACPTLALSYENLLSRIAQHYNYKIVVRLPLADEDTPVKSADMLLIFDQAPGMWATLYTQYIDLVRREGLVVINDIHKAPEHTAAWAKLCANEQVKMSIDLYGIGLLLFRNEFKEKQHFVLKYAT